MTQNELLKQLGVSKEEFTDLMTRYSLFEKSLTPNQRALLNRSHRTLEEAAEAFGPDMTPSDLTHILKELLHSGPPHVFSLCCIHPSPPPGPGNGDE